jgi:excisionase family DNA binding protein
VSSKPCARPRNLEAELLDFEAAGALVGFSGRTVRRMVDRGDFVAAIEVPGVRGRRLRRSDIMAWLEAIAGDTASRLTRSDFRSPSPSSGQAESFRLRSPAAAAKGAA